MSTTVSMSSVSGCRTTGLSRKREGASFEVWSTLTVSNARRRRSQQAASAAIDGSSYPQRTRFLRSLEEQLEDIYASRTGILFLGF